MGWIPALDCSNKAILKKNVTCVDGTMTKGTIVRIIGKNDIKSFDIEDYEGHIIKGVYPDALERYDL